MYIYIYNTIIIMWYTKNKTHEYHDVSNLAILYEVLYMYEINYYTYTACCICMKSIIIYVQRVVYV